MRLAVIAILPCGPLYKHINIYTNNMIDSGYASFCHCLLYIIFAFVTGQLNELGKHLTIGL